MTGHSSNSGLGKSGRLLGRGTAECDRAFEPDGPKPNHHDLFPWCEHRQFDPTRPTKSWRTAWRHALKRAGFRCRFHDLRVTCITKLAESQASDMTIMAIAGHVSQRMLEHYSRIRMEAKRQGLEAIAGSRQAPDFGASIHHNGNQIGLHQSEAVDKLLN